MADTRAGAEKVKADPEHLVMQKKTRKCSNIDGVMYEIESQLKWIPADQIWII